MRLINTETLHLENFLERKVPPYAILSHTWTEEEVSLQEFIDPKSDTARKQGYDKIVKTCQLARQDKLSYAWVDTCCIDKTSSAELSEAINSMFQWYERAEVCYAYLSDFPENKEIMHDSWKIGDPDPQTIFDFNAFISCKWFTRGWTLQELIAPKALRFFDEAWTWRGTKFGYSIEIGSRLGINDDVLLNSYNRLSVPLAKRMSWASGRQTTRVEDIAYCLLGIFNIHMPLLYGEGDKAFARLQEEIIKTDNDLTILGWSDSEARFSPPWSHGQRKGYRGCLVDCGHQEQRVDDVHPILASSIGSFGKRRRWLSLFCFYEHSVTSRGIRIRCSLLQVCLDGCESISTCRCCFSCRAYVLPIAFGVGMTLTKVAPDTFIRRNGRLIWMDENIRFSFFSNSPTRERPVYLRDDYYGPQWGKVSLEIGTEEEVSIHSVTPEHRWNSSKRLWYIDDTGRKDWGIVMLEYPHLGRLRKTCVLFSHCNGRAILKFLDPRVYRIELALVSSASSMTSDEVHGLFDFSQEPGSSDENEHIRGSLVMWGNWRLRVESVRHGQ